MIKNRNKNRRQRTVPCLLLTCAILFSGCSFDGKYQEKTAEIAVTETEQQGDFTWDANWIWGDFQERDSWLMARKTVDLNEAPAGEPVWADISCDSKYWLYINGETVVRDGNLKRGRTPNSTYYDSVDVSSYLKEGVNVIAIRVWYWGAKGVYSYRTSGQGGLLFQMDVEDQHIISDDSWLVRRDEAFDNTHDDSNYRLPESDIYYIAKNELTGWEKPNYEGDESKWQGAKVLGEAGEDPWGELLRRDIPQFRDSEEKQYENADEMPWKKTGEYTTTEDETFTLKLPYNAQVYPMLCVDTEESAKIRITSDMYEDNNGNSVMTTYVTKPGRQSFETFAWTNGEAVIYEIPAGVTIYDLTYRETGYDTDLSGTFSCEDEFYNELWEKSVRSVYVNMRDTYMDCPNRERANWTGDMGLEALVSMRSMSPNSSQLFASNLRTVLGNSSYNLLWTINPTEEEVELLLQSLMLVPTVYDYYLYTGDVSLVEESYEPICAFMGSWGQKEDGTYECILNYPYHMWGDSTENTDYWALENAWICGVFDTLEKMAAVLDKEEDAAIFREKKEALQKAYRKAFWTETGYRSTYVEEPDERANAVAVLTGIATEDQYDVIAKLMEEQFYSTPLLEYYIECACCEMGRVDLAQMRMKKRYDAMINAPEEKETSTLWEHFTYKEGTLNHGWAAGPLVIMSRYMGGINPLSVGYETYEIKPDMGELNSLETSLDTIYGIVEVNVEKGEDVKSEGEADENAANERIVVSQPAGVTARVAVEKTGENPLVKVNGKTVYKNGESKDRESQDFKAEFIEEDENFLYFNIKGEHIEIACYLAP